MQSVIIDYGIRFAIETVILLVSLLIMLKIQSLQFNFLGLLGAAALSSALDFIPFVGYILSAGALLYAMSKVTRSHYSDVLFTVGIGFALSFCFNLFLLGMIMGDLRPSARHKKSDEAVQEFKKQSESATGTNTMAQPKATNDAVAVVAVSPPPKTNATAVQPPVQSLATNAAVDQAAAELKKESALKKAVAGKFSLKSVIQNGDQSMATIDTGTKSYSLVLNESLSMDTPKGKFLVRLEKVYQDSVVVDVAGEKAIISR